jgi:hypothetical protein
MGETLQQLNDSPQQVVVTSEESSGEGGKSHDVIVQIAFALRMPVRCERPCSSHKAEE